MTERLPAELLALQRERELEGEALRAALAGRARPGERPEETLFDLGLLSSRDFALELAARSGLPFLGLRGFLVDERLLLYVPHALALAERVCPIVMVGDSLKVATAYLEPDLDSVRSRFPHLDIELVVAPRDEILEALSDAATAVR